MPVVRYALILASVVTAAGLTIWVAASLAPEAAAPTGWIYVPLLAAALLLILRHRR